MGFRSDNIDVHRRIMSKPTRRISCVDKPKSTPAVKSGRHGVPMKRNHGYAEISFAGFGVPLKDRWQEVTYSFCAASGGKQFPVPLYGLDHRHGRQIGVASAISAEGWHVILKQINKSISEERKIS
jgi:hypothetical protein